MPEVTAWAVGFPSMNGIAINPQPTSKGKTLRHEKLLVLGIVVLGGLFLLSAFSQPALAAERIVQFDNPGCA